MLGNLEIIKSKPPNLELSQEYLDSLQRVVSSSLRQRLSNTVLTSYAIQSDVADLELAD